MKVRLYFRHVVRQELTNRHGFPAVAAVGFNPSVRSKPEWPANAGRLAKREHTLKSDQSARPETPFVSLSRDGDALNRPLDRRWSTRTSAHSGFTSHKGTKPRRVARREVASGDSPVVSTLCLRDFVWDLPESGPPLCDLSASRGIKTAQQQAALIHGFASLRDSSSVPSRDRVSGDGLDAVYQICGWRNRQNRRPSLIARVIPDRLPRPRGKVQSGKNFNATCRPALSGNRVLGFDVFRPPGLQTHPAGAGLLFRCGSVLSGIG